MHRRPLLWQLFPSYLLIAVVVLVLVLWVGTGSLRKFLLDEKRTDLKASQQLIETAITPLLLAHDRRGLGQYVRTAGQTSGIRISVFSAGAELLVDSEGVLPPRSERRLRSALPNPDPKTNKQSFGYVHASGEARMYVANRLESKGERIGYVRISMPVGQLTLGARSVYLKAVPSVILILLLTALASRYISSRISDPLEELKRGAQKFAAGDLDLKLRAPQASELGSLARAMNSMATQLKEKIRIVVKQRNELDAVLSSMIDGVVAVDAEERIINMNQAALQLTGLPGPEVQGRHIDEVLRSTNLKDLIKQILSTGEPLEEELTLHQRKDRYLKIYGRALTDEDNTFIGALIVLNDVTQIRQLENVRRDFVANVSHELKTPITSIKGFVETLLDGAMHDPNDLQRFLKIVSNQADRLNAIIEDLLSLSRLEHSGQEIELEQGEIVKVLHSAVQFSEIKAKQKNVKLNVVCEENLFAPINPPLLEQAIVNLVDNAIKYSDEGTTVTISGRTADDHVVISVQDQGRGITKEHLPRLFERFYRVDKARSRVMGGTGLGLALVKHISQAHGGYPSVESTPGEGSIFSIHLADASLLSTRGQVA